MSRASLIIPKSEFESILDSLIAEGEDILKSAPVPQNPYNAIGNPSFNAFGYNLAQDEDFMKEYNKWHGLCVEFLESSFDNDQNKYKKGFVNIGNIGIFTSNTDRTRLRKKDLSELIDYLKGLKDKLRFMSEKPGLYVPDQTSAPDVTSSKADGNNVFIVHGHNELIKEKMARALTELGLRPIILHEQANGGRTIIEKLERESEKTSFAVVLLTADDLGRAKTDTIEKFRARQNVVLELGLFIGKLGRNHVMALMEEGVEKPGDIDGFVYTPIDKSNDWKQQLVKELRHAGFDVSADNLS